jgi:uncharacterized membrane protein YecN with MAPEG domain
MSPNAAPRMPITPIYAAGLALVFVGLSIRTIRLRRRARVAIGDGGDRRLARATRAHANFAEYVPLALLLVYFVEAPGAPRPAIHALCMMLLAGRLAHAWGVSQEPEDFRFRVAGMALTFSVLGLAALALLYRAATD